MQATLFLPHTIFAQANPLISMKRATRDQGVQQSASQRTSCHLVSWDKMVLVSYEARCHLLSWARMSLAGQNSIVVIVDFVV